MPILITLCEEEGYFTSHFIGSINDRELLEAYEKFFNTHHPIGFNELVDLSDADLTSLSVAALGTEAGASNERNALRTGAPKMTAVYAPTDLAAGLAHMYAVGLNEDTQVFRVFRDWDDAVAWLRGEESEEIPKPGAAQFGNPR